MSWSTYYRNCRAHYGPLLRLGLPVIIGQVGLIGGSGLINGLMQCDCPHIIKGRIIKERHERREENHSERGELISTDVIETITNRMVFNILTPTGFRSLV